MKNREIIFTKTGIAITPTMAVMLLKQSGVLDSANRNMKFFKVKRKKSAVVAQLAEQSPCKR